jgi:hypothetical protein
MGGDGVVGALGVYNVLLTQLGHGALIFPVLWLHDGVGRNRGLGLVINPNSSGGS